MLQTLKKLLSKKEYLQSVSIILLLILLMISSKVFKRSENVIDNVSDNDVISSAAPLSDDSDDSDDCANNPADMSASQSDCVNEGDKTNDDVNEFNESSDESSVDVNEDASDELSAEEICTVEDFSDFNPDEAFSYCDQPVCLYNRETNEIDFIINFNSVPESDDLNIYVFEQPTYEADDYVESKSPFATGIKNESVTISFPFEKHLLFSRFVPCILFEGKYVPLSLGQYVTNPEDVANNNTEYPHVASKKGLLLDPMTLDKEELTDLNVKRVVYNIPLSYIMGETSNATCPTINYEYLGITYQFDGFSLNGFDSMFKYLSENDYHITVIILNDWNDYYPLLIHPDSRNRTGSSKYYAFNTTDESGVRIMEVAALFLAERYSSGEYGLVHDWIIANEINQQRIWHYMATSDIKKFTDNFEKTFRTFYNAIKANYANAHISFSIDHDWNDNGGNNAAFFNGKELVTVFNEIAKSHGDYDWGLSIHPYPTPLTQTRFWYGYQNKSENAGVITPMNLSVLTNFMQQEEFLNTSGEVRDIGVTELGFSSKSGEKTQAAAFAYCYYIINDNPYIDSFLMNRQTDSYLSLRSGLALGIYNPDYSAKYIKEVFANIDTVKGHDYIPEMLEIIGANSFEEALEKAR